MSERPSRRVWGQRPGQARKLRFLLRILDGNVGWIVCYMNCSLSSRQMKKRSSRQMKKRKNFVPGSQKWGPVFLGSFQQAAVSCRWQAIQLVLTPPVVVMVYDLFNSSNQILVSFKWVAVSFRITSDSLSETMKDRMTFEDTSAPIL